jgi:hypothetical protein
MPRDRGLTGALLSTSALRPRVQPGIQALKNVDREHIERGARGLFEDSLALDSALEDSSVRENRWDYLLGERGIRSMVAIEVHNATGKDVDRMIRKMEWALRILPLHFRDQMRVRRWFWIASGKTGLTAGTTEYKRMIKAGLRLVGGMLLRKHLAEPD